MLSSIVTFSMLLKSIIFMADEAKFGIFSKEPVRYYIAWPLYKNLRAIKLNHPDVLLLLVLKMSLYLLI